MAARSTVSGRLTLLNTQLTIRSKDRSLETHTAETPAELLRLLAEYFGLHFPEGTVFEWVSGG